MRPSSTINHPPQTAQPQTLHPVIKEALGSLDVQLEEELTRYRRQRALGKSGYNPRKEAPKAAAKILPPPAIAAPAPQPSRSATDGAIPSGEAGSSAAVSGTSGAKSYSELKELAKHYASQIDQKAELAAASPGGPEDYLESSEELLRSLAEEEARLEAEQGFLKSLSTPFGIGAMLLLLLSSAMFGFVLMNPSSITQWFNKKAPQVATRLENPVEPSASGSMTTGTVPQPDLANQEFPDLNLSTLGSLKVDSSSTAKPGSPATASAGSGKKAQKANIGVSGGTLAGKGSSQVATGSAIAPAEVEPAPPANDLPSPRRLAPAPDYNAAPARTYSAPSTPVKPYTPPASRSYGAPSGNSASPRTTVKPSAPAKTRTPAKKPTAVSPTPSLPPLKLIPEPSPAASSTPTPPINTVSPSPAPSASSSPSAGVQNGYKVVVPYTSDRALEQAREKVPDAYLQNYSDGAKVQMGAYDTEPTAKKRAEELRQQGIPAEVYKP